MILSVTIDAPHEKRGIFAMGLEQKIAVMLHLICPWQHRFTFITALAPFSFIGRGLVNAFKENNKHIQIDFEREGRKWLDWEYAWDKFTCKVEITGSKLLISFNRTGL